MTSGWLKARATRFSAYVTVYIIVVLAVLAFVNFLANRHNKSVDTTANKRFSLSDQTEKVVRGLQQDVKVTYFDRTDRFAQARDLLDRYDNLSTKLSVEYIDPYKKPQVARTAGVRTEGTTFIQVGDKKEEARSVTEEELTGALIRALKGGKRSVCAVQGSGEHGLDDSGRSGYSQFKELMEKNNYTTQSISLLQKPEVPKECTVVLVGGPRLDYVEPVIKALKAFVEGGGKAMFLIDPQLKLGNLETTENPELMKLLAGWGVTASKDLILDLNPVSQIFGLGPEVPLVTNYESHAIVREMRDVGTAFPLSRSLEVKSADKTTVEKLFASSSNSYATTKLDRREIRLDPKTDKKGPFTIAAAGTYNTGQPNQQGRFVVVGSSSWTENAYIRFNGNRDLAMNMLNWLSADEDLISIRPKEPEDRRLNMNRAQMTRVFWGSVVFMPLAAIVAGVWVWWRRR